MNLLGMKWGNDSTPMRLSILSLAACSLYAADPSRVIEASRAVRMLEIPDTQANAVFLLSPDELLWQDARGTITIGNAKGEKTVVKRTPPGPVLAARGRWMIFRPPAIPGTPLVAFDRTTGESRQLLPVSMPFPRTGFAIDGDRLAWLEMDSRGVRVVVIDLLQGTTVGSATVRGAPETSHVAWLSKGTAVVVDPSLMRFTPVRVTDDPPVGDNYTLWGEDARIASKRAGLAVRVDASTTSRNGTHLALHGGYEAKGDGLRLAEYNPEGHQIGGYRLRIPNFNAAATRGIDTQSLIAAGETLAIAARDGTVYTFDRP